VDRMSMAHGLEVRAPLSDFELVDFVTSLPIEYRLRGCRSKHILKRVSRRWIDPAIAERTKVGFDSPIGQWFKNELRSFLLGFMAPAQIAQSGLLNPSAVQRLIGDHLSGRRDHSLQLWSLLSLEAWHRMYIEDRITDGSAYRLADLRGAVHVAPVVSSARTAPPAAAARADAASAPSGPIHVAVRCGLKAYLAALRAAGALGRRPRLVDDRGCDLLLTGAFQSSSWVEHHLRPLAASAACASVTLVANGSMTPVDKVTVVRPPAWLIRAVGEAPARFLVFTALALRRRPHVVGGFHLLFNGLAAALVAPVVGARSMYICVGGPMEVVNGGILAENRLFNRLRGPDLAVERLLVRATTAFDIIVTMGSGAAAFLMERGAKGQVHVIPGGLDRARYRPSSATPGTDIIFVGRLAPIKRPELLLEAIERVTRVLPALKATIVGDGDLRAALEERAGRLGIAHNVVFTGRRADVHHLLQAARVFVLTSQSEGVALSLMEALACGVPAVAPRVGDLGDVLADGVNGFLVDGDSPDAFAVRILDLLTNEPKRIRFAEAAQRAAHAYDVAAMALRWDDVLRGRPMEPTGYSSESSMRPIRARIARSS